MSYAGNDYIFLLFDCFSRRVVVTLVTFKTFQIPLWTWGDEAGFLVFAGLNLNWSPSLAG